MALLTYHNVRDIGRIGFFTLIAWLTPPRLWRTAAQLTCSIGRSKHSWPAIKKIFANDYSDADLAGATTKLPSYMRELTIQILGLAGPWRSWRPDIHLNGIIHLRTALESGHGAILWVTETAFSTLIVKMALYNAGFKAIQLSRPGHGFSASNFGVRFLNPFWIAVEDRFIGERVLIVGETATDALAVLQTRLGANQIVIITVVPQAHKFVQVPFFQAQLRIPTGPIRLARATGAALLPVFATAEDNGAFEVSIEEPLRPSDSLARDEDIAAGYVKRLEPFVRKHPDQWRGWLHHPWFAD